MKYFIGVVFIVVAAVLGSVGFLVGGLISLFMRGWYLGWIAAASACEVLDSHKKDANNDS